MNYSIAEYIMVVSATVGLVLICSLVPILILVVIKEQHSLKKFKTKIYDKLKIMDVSYDMANNLQLCLSMKTYLVLVALRKLKAEIDFDNLLDEQTILLYRERVNNLIYVYDERDPFSGLPEEIKSSLQRLKNQFNISDVVHLDNLILAIKKSLKKKNRLAIVIGIVGFIANFAPFLLGHFGMVQ